MQGQHRSLPIAPSPTILPGHDQGQQLSTGERRMARGRPLCTADDPFAPPTTPAWSQTDTLFPCLLPHSVPHFFPPTGSFESLILQPPQYESRSWTSGRTRAWQPHPAAPTPLQVDCHHLPPSGLHSAQLPGQKGSSRTSLIDTAMIACSITLTLELNRLIRLVYSGLLRLFVYQSLPLLTKA